MINFLINFFKNILLKKNVKVLRIQNIALFRKSFKKIDKNIYLLLIISFKIHI